jgi:hypothetical protein
MDLYHLGMAILNFFIGVWLLSLVNSWGNNRTTNVITLVLGLLNISFGCLYVYSIIFKTM